MSTPLANPRRTRLVSWPTQDRRDQDTEQATRPAEAPSVPAEDDRPAS
ncbi:MULTISPECIES: hypothetical protein [Actinomadura]|uniref:Uncharacterized protein n=1 Tax=Actinomadura rubteroloni TaxID=1926885 RepID=A0A2P4URC5_9ACTN|nr:MULTISPECIES: hypothetical protein [Actinomadura]POM27598.1 hypothetical protein BTM25_20140 [Actinomadura rubteroloni]